MDLVDPVIQYQILITPLVAKRTYGTEIDVTKDVDISEFVGENGISTIKKEIDNGDYEIGIFTFGDININCINQMGRFSGPEDYRTIFKYSRDKAKVVVNYLDGDGDVIVRFKGITEELGTREDFFKEEVKLKVLSEDSILRKSKIPAGVIQNGATFSSAIDSILNNPEVTNLLSYNFSNVAVALDLQIDDGSWFDNRSRKEGLDALMLCCGSVLNVEDSTIYVRTRDVNLKGAFTFHGPGDVFGRENILKITQYNNGMQRMINSVVVNGFEVSDDDLVDEYGLRQKSFDFEFLTTPSKQNAVGTSILNEFKVPKAEMLLEAPTDIVQDLTFFDPISINYPYRIVPSGDNPIPYFGSSIFGEAVFPEVYGNIRISPRKAWKIIGRQEKAKNMTTILKLRERGQTFSDSDFFSFSSLFGSAIFGLSEFQADPDYLTADTYNVLGGARFGIAAFGAKP